MLPDLIFPQDTKSSRNESSPSAHPDDLEF